MKQLAQRLVVAVLGVAATLAWWTFRGGGSSGKELASMPAQVWSGGAGVTIEAELSHAGFVRAVFERRKPGGKEHEHELLTVHHKLPPGAHSFSLAVPDGVSGSVEVEVDPANTPVGASTRVALVAGGKRHEDKQSLSAPLGKGEALFAQIELDDWAKGVLEDESVDEPADN